MDDGLEAARPLELADYRRRVAENYAAARHAGSGAGAWAAWREPRDLLIGTHPQSPLPMKHRSPGWHTPFFSHDPGWRFTAPLVASDDPVVLDLPHSSDGSTRFVEIGFVSFEHGGRSHTLSVFWLDGYSGGLFIPFTDATAGATTYGAGRYLLDTAKGADLGATDDGELILDFNYAYHPSCAWDAAWSCPLAPPRNRLDVPVEAGELLPLG